MDTGVIIAIVIGVLVLLAVLAVAASVAARTATRRAGSKPASFAARVRFVARGPTTLGPRPTSARRGHDARRLPHASRRCRQTSCGGRG